MRTATLIITFVLTFTFAKGNVDCIWESRKSGVWIRYIAPCDFQTPIFLDSFINKTVLFLNRQDTSLKILVLVSNGKLSFPESRFSNFISVGYDTLREIDDDFIFDYYWAKENRGTRPYDTKSRPININSTNNRTVPNVGIKIIYDEGYALTKSNWNEISKLIVYGVKNVDSVRHSQKTDTVRYNTNGWYVTLVTLDTFTINNILGKKAVDHGTHSKAIKSSSNSYFIIAALGLTVILTLMFIKRKHGS